MFLIAPTSFDGPATTDAALAALAAEAGLIDPEPNKDGTERNMTPGSVEQNIMVVQADEQTDIDSTAEGEASAPTETASVGLFGGSSIYKKIGLKGGSKIRLGLFGGSPMFPPCRPITYKGGLLGGSKDIPDDQQSQDSGISLNSNQNSLNGNSIKHDSTDNEDFKMDIDDSSAKSSLEDSTTDDEKLKTDFESSLENIDSESETLEEKKTESGDALSALASAAALHHSKDFHKTDSVTKELKDDKDVWHTVGFIKGTSFDVQNYFLCEEDDSNITIDHLPDYSHLPRISLEPGTAYKFRVAAINSVGRGDWSEVT